MEDEAIVADSAGHIMIDIEALRAFEREQADELRSPEGDERVAEAG